MENLYSNSSFDAEPMFDEYGDIRAKMKKIEKALGKARKKKKGEKKGGNKKLKNRIKMLELEHEQLKYFLKAFAIQQNTEKEKKSDWWQKALANSLPKVVDLASSMFQNRSRPIHVLPAKNQPLLYLSDSSDRK